MDNQYATEYRELYQKHWWWRAREEAILNVLQNLNSLQSNANILDIGCGDGLLFEKLSQFGKPHGVEVDESTVSDDCRWRESIHVGPFDGSFAPQKKFGLILMLDVLEHIEDAPAALSRALSLLDDEGRMIITVPAFRSLWTSHDELNHHFTRYSKKTFQSLAVDSGMAVHQLDYMFHWTCPIKLAMRMKESILRATPSLPTVPPAWLNRLFLGLSRMEQRSITRMSMPFGSSLLATGQRA